MAEGTGDLLYDLDCSTRQLDWGTSLRAFGYPDELRLTPLSWWEERIHPEDSATPLADFAQVLAGRERRYVAQYRFRCADGSYRHVWDRGTLVTDARGVPVRVVGHMEDLHLHYQMFLFNPQPMWVFHRQSLQFLAVNDAALQHYGYGKDEFLQLFLTDIRPAEDVERLKAVVASPDRQHEGRNAWRHLKKNGETIQVEVRTQDVDWHGQPARIALMTDVTNRLAAEEKFRTRQQLEAVALIAGGLAHDFNNLLTVIGGQSQRLLERRDWGQHPDARAAFETIHEASLRASQLVRRLLSFTRGERPEPQVIVPQAFLEDFAPFLRKIVPEPLQLVCTADSQAPAIEADPTQLEQVLLNLVWNAVDALEGGRGTVTVRFQDASPGAQPVLRIEVEDDGPGMSAEIAQRVFEPLFGTKPAGKGSGLGLSTANAILRSMGAAMQLETSPGHGARFWIDIPGVRLAPPPPAPAAPRLAARILLIDDDARVRATVRAQLEDEGLEVTEAADGQAGTLLLEAYPFDLVITDLVMPEREGLEIIQYLRRRHPAIPVIAMSGAFEGQFLHMAKTFGAAAVLVKPVAAARLLSSVRNLLQDAQRPPTDAAARPRSL